MDIMFILHAEHEMNCSTAAARHLASSGVDVYTAIAGDPRGHAYKTYTLFAWARPTVAMLVRLSACLATLTSAVPDCLPLCLSACLSACLPACLSVVHCLCIYLFVCLSVCVVRLFMRCLSICMSVCVSVHCLPVCLSLRHFLAALFT